MPEAVLNNLRELKMNDGLSGGSGVNTILVDSNYFVDNTKNYSFSVYNGSAATQMAVFKLFIRQTSEYVFPDKASYELAKRFIDICLCLVLSPFVFLILTFTGVLIKLDSKGPIFFAQTRVGANGKLFMIFKLRSMVTDAEKKGEAKWAIKHDPRITRVGKFIRATRLDELPQLWNIFKGEMSLIGPRPERPEFVLEFSKDIPNFILRNSIKPGVTGWAQVNGGYELVPEDKLKYDLHYVQKRGIWLDLLIVFKTFRVIFTADGAY